MHDNRKLSQRYKDKKELGRFLKIINSESKINSVGFHDIHELCKKVKMGFPPKKEILISKIREKGFKASETHFKGEGIRSDIDEEKLILLIKSLNN